jgi:hypothetical protein
MARRPDNPHNVKLAKRIKAHRHKGERDKGA